jgi:AcrR family transcriptional regulator
MSESDGHAPPESHVLAVAINLCREKGYGGVSIEKVAADAGVDASDVWRRWPSKSALLIDALRVEVAGDLVYPDTGDFEADMRTQLRAISRLFSDPSISPHLARLVGEAQRGPAVAEEFRERVYAPNRTAARRRFHKAQQEGQLRDDVDIDAAIDLTFAPFWFRLLLQSGPMTEEYVEAIVDMSLRGLRPS